MNEIGITGYPASATTPLTFLQQVTKTWKEKPARDIFLLMFVIAAVNEVTWIAYGGFLHNRVIILTNAIVLSISFK